jgi:hypothetical protein
MNTREQLLLSIKEAENVFEKAKNALSVFDRKPENNFYASLKDAQGLEKILRKKAVDDCEGAGNCCFDTYIQTFLIDGNKYEAILHVEYGRHDKTYYFVEESKFSIEECSDVGDTK